MAQLEMCAHARWARERTPVKSRSSDASMAWPAGSRKLEFFQFAGATTLSRFGSKQLSLSSTSVPVAESRLLPNLSSFLDLETERWI